VTVASAGEDSVIAFDLGGTWFRSAVVDSGGCVHDVRRTPSIGWRAHPGASALDLQRRLLRYVLDDVVARCAQRPGAAPTVGISIGAAVHGTSGLILASAPLWGPTAAPFDLLCELAAAAPEVSWSIVNDVSAAALAFAELPWVRMQGARKLAALTISTGVALRTVYVASGRIATDRDHGLQGEIGHLGADVLLAGELLSLRCDCGASNHLSAFLSGRGIPNVLAAAGYAQDARDPLCAFVAAVRAAEPVALALLDAITLPLARVLLDLAVLDPECELVVLYGGVASALGEPLRRSVVENLGRLGMYGVTDRDPGFFDRRIRLEGRDHFGLIGAARAAAVDRETDLSPGSGR
jgi:glucokinase